MASWRAWFVGGLVVLPGAALSFACADDSSAPAADAGPETSVPEAATEQRDADVDPDAADAGPRKPGWGAPVLLETADGTADSPKVAMDDEGNAIAVWRQQLDATKFGVWASRFKASSGAWSTPRRLDEGAGETAQVTIGMNTKGTAFIVWRQNDKDTPVITKLWSYRFFPDGGDGHWTGPNPVDYTVQTATNHPSVTVDEMNNGFAAFAGPQTIWVSRFPYNAGKWDPAEAVSGAGAVSVAAPCIGVEPKTNNLLLNWARGNGVKFDIWGNAHTFNGWGTAKATEEGAGKKGYPSCDPSGRWLAWLQEIDGGVSAMGTVFIDLGANPSSVLGTGHADIVDPDHHPRVARHTTVWTEGARTLVSEVSGGSWVAAGSISNGLGPTRQAQIARGGVTGAFAVWVQESGARSDVWMNMRLNGVVWGKPERVETEDGNASNPHVAMAPLISENEGDGVIVWQQSDGTRDNIWARSYR